MSAEISVAELLDRCAAAQRAMRGERAFVLLAVPGHYTQRRFLLRMGPARLWSRVMGWRDLGQPTVSTAVRLWVDEVLRELERAGLVTRKAPPVAVAVSP